MSGKKTKGDDTMTTRPENKGGDAMNIIEIVDLLKNILEVLDKLYHATIGEENDNAADSE